MQSSAGLLTGEAEMVNFHILGVGLCGVLLFQQEMWVQRADTVLRLVSEGCLLAPWTVWTRDLRSTRLDEVLPFNSVSSSTDNLGYDRWDGEEHLDALLCGEPYLCGQQ